MIKKIHLKDIHNIFINTNRFHVYLTFAKYNILNSLDCTGHEIFGQKEGKNKPCPKKIGLKTIPYRKSEYLWRMIALCVRWPFREAAKGCCCWLCMHQPRLASHIFRTIWDHTHHSNVYQTELNFVCPRASPFERFLHEKLL